VLDDVREGYVTATSARSDYGVVIDETAMQIDEEGTATLRSR
jgi:hypothetical protein